MLVTLVLGGRNSHIPRDLWSATVANQLALGLVRDLVIENMVLSDKDTQHQPLAPTFM